MRKYLLLTLPLLFAAPAMAQDATGTVSIDGNVEGRCLFTTPNETISVGEMSLDGADDTAGRLDSDAIDGQSATLVGWCNHAAAEISVKANALENTADPATGFTNVVNFIATASAGSVSPSDDSAIDGEGDAETVGLFTGDIVVTLDDSSAPGDDLLVAGDYVGSVIVTLSPKFVATQEL